MVLPLPEDYRLLVESRSLFIWTMVSLALPMDSAKAVATDSLG